jgi:hypothetical protein
MKEELAIACILYTAEKEGLTPENVLWALVPIENCPIMSDSSGHDKEENQGREGSGSNP